MADGTYLVIKEDVLPEVFNKIVKVNEVLSSSKNLTVSEAVKTVGISRSVYYKYRDVVFLYKEKTRSGIFTIQALLLDKPGVLIDFLAVFYRANANILTVNQNIPLKGRAFVSVSARIGNMSMSPGALVDRLKVVSGVLNIDSIVE